MVTTDIRAMQVSIRWLIHSLGVDSNQYMGLKMLFDCFFLCCYSREISVSLEETFTLRLFLWLSGRSLKSLAKILT